MSEAGPSEIGTVLFTKGTEVDDSECIRHYDHVLGLIEKKLNKPSDTISKPSAGPAPKSSKTSTSAVQRHAVATSNKWHVGDLCVAPWSQDGVYYHARILRVEPPRVQVKFVDYGNVDWCQIEDLNDDDEEGDEDVAIVEDNETLPHAKQNASSFHSHQTGQAPTPLFPFPSGQPSFSMHSQPAPLLESLPFSRDFIPPPRLSQFPGALGTSTNSDISSQEDVALHSTLMSWYMCGYHTGYHQALKHSREGHATGRSARK